MTQGERSIWAAAFVESLREFAKDAARNTELGLRVSAHVPARAAIDAARAVRTARSALPKLIEMPVSRPEWQEARDESIEMLREMLGAPEVKLR